LTCSKFVKFSLAHTTSVRSGMSAPIGPTTPARHLPYFFKRQVLDTQHSPTATAANRHPSSSLPLIHAHRCRRPTLPLPPPHPATASRPRPPRLIRPLSANPGALLPQVGSKPLLPRLLYLDFGGDVCPLTRYSWQDLSPPHPMCGSRLRQPFS
jgi:hypothetical protein